MTPTAAPPKFETWNPPGHSFRIEYSVAVLEQIREISVDGYHRVPHGGVETGGILFGTHAPDLVRILAWRPIACSYARGPSFVLSEKDETALSESLASPPGDADHGPLELVGWYRAHTRSEVLLSDTDVIFFDRFFPQSWQVGLIVRPASFNPTRAGFFFREPDSRIRSESSYLEFTLRPVIVDQMPPMPEALDASPSPVAQIEPAPEPVSEPPVPHAGVPRWVLYAAGIVLLAAVVLGFWLLRPVHRNLLLSASDTGGQLRITWDGTAAWIGDARGGSVEIEDRGVRTQVKLTPADLHSGNLIYARQSGNVGVRMSVEVPGIRPVVETTRFLGPPAKEPEPQPQTQPQSTETPADPPASHLPPAPVRAAAPLPPPVTVAVTRRPVRFRAPNAVPQKSSSAMPNMAPPAIDNLPVTPAAGVPTVIGQAPASPPPVVIPHPAAAAAPASGRIVWTGRLGKNVRLVIDRNHASTGTLTGPLPAVAARVSAYPGDLTNGGITLFTADPKYAQPITEKAGAENGWNWTTYTLAPKRAGGIRVIEQPAPQNNYRLVLESDIPKLSVVMLVWRAQ